MTIQKLTAGVNAQDPTASDGGDVATAVNGLIGNVKRVYNLGVVGDSRLANARRVSGRNYQFKNQAVVTWLRALSLQRVDMPAEFSLAVSGSTTAQVLTQTQAMVALPVKPNFCLVNGGTNDFEATPTLAALNAAVANIINSALLLRNAGILPIVEIDVPRSGGAWVDAAIVSAGFNKALREQCGINGLLLCDYESMYIQADGNPATGFNVSDGVHPSCTGSSVRATKYVEVLSSVLGGFTSRMATARDTYSSTLNPRGNMLANGLMTGTGGSNIGTGASGSVPTGWANRVISGTMTAVASKLAPESSGNQSDRLQVACSFTTDGEYGLRLNGSVVGAGATLPAGLVIGDLLYGELDLEITALSGVFNELNLTLFDQGNTGQVSSVTDFYTDTVSGNPMPVVPLPAPNGVGNIYTTLKFRMKTPTFPWSDNPANLSNQLHWRFIVKGSAGAAITFIVSNCAMRKL